MAIPVRWHDSRSARSRDCFTAGGYPKLRYEQRWQAKSAARKLAAQPTLIDAEVKRIDRWD